MQKREMTHKELLGRESLLGLLRAPNSEEFQEIDI